MDCYRIYCNTEQQYQYVWGDTPPTTCPVDAGHAVNPDSVNVRFTQQKVQFINDQNSPFSVARVNFLACDTSNADVTVVLPVAGGTNAGRTVMLIKTSADHTLSLSPATGETIDSSTSNVSTTGYSSVLCVTSDGTTNWLTVADPYALPLSRLDSTTSDGANQWIFREVIGNALSAGSTVSRTWTPRVLNETYLDSGNNVILGTGGTFTLQQGSYRIRADSVFYNSQYSRLRWYNTTDNRTEIISLSICNTPGALGSSSVTVALDGTVTVPPTVNGKTYQLQYYVTQAQTNGLGKAVGTGDMEVYTIVKVEAVA